MGKLVVVFYTLLAFQVVFSAVTRESRHGQEELKDLLHQASKISENVLELLENTPITWENSHIPSKAEKFIREVEKVTNDLEDLAKRCDGHVSGVINNVVRKLHDFRINFQQVWTLSDTNSTHRRESTVKKSFIKYIKSLESLVKVYDEESANAVDFHEIKSILKKFVFALERLEKHIKHDKCQNSEVSDVRVNKVRIDFTPNKWKPYGYHKNEWENTEEHTWEPVSHKWNPYEYHKPEIKVEKYHNSEDAENKVHAGSKPNKWTPYGYHKNEWENTEERPRESVSNKWSSYKYQSPEDKVKNYHNFEDAENRFHAGSKPNKWTPYGYHKNEWENTEEHAGEPVSNKWSPYKYHKEDKVEKYHNSKDAENKFHTVSKPNKWTPHGYYKNNWENTEERYRNPVSLKWTPLNYFKGEDWSQWEPEVSMTNKWARNQYRRNERNEEFVAGKWVPYKNNKNHTDIQTNVKELKIVLERINFNNALMQRCFVHLIREYLDNVREFAQSQFPEQFDFFFKTEGVLPMNEIKSHLYSFIKVFVENVEQMPEVARVAFSKATRKFQSRVEIMAHVNAPIRQLAVEMFSLAQQITSGLEIIPLESQHVRGVIGTNARKFLKHLERFVAHIDDAAARTNWKKIITRLEADEWSKHMFIVTIQSAVSEAHRLLISLPSNAEATFKIGTEFVQILQAQKRLFTELIKGIRNPDVWSLHAAANTNKMSMFFHGEVSNEDTTVLTRALEQILQVLEEQPHVEFKETGHRLSKIVDTFKIEKYLINTFLQKVFLELNQLLWKVYQRTGTLPVEIIEIMSLYINAIDDVYNRHAINKGLLIVQTPAEIIMKARIAADDVNKLLHSIAPGFKRPEMFYRGQRFYELIKVILHRFERIKNGSNVFGDSVKTVYENLLKLKNSLKDDLEEMDKDLNVKLAIYVQETVMHLQNLAFDPDFTNDSHFVEMYADFMFGIKRLISQVQYDFQVVMEHYSYKTFSMQLDSVYQRMSILLHRIQLKPELQHVIFTQIEMLTQVVENWSIYYNELELTDLATKYNKMTEQLKLITKTGINKSIEELCALLDKNVREVILDLYNLTHLIGEVPELSDAYRYNLITFSHMMIRLDNVQSHEYYHSLMKKQNFVGLIRKLSLRISNKLQQSRAENEEDKNNMKIESLKYVQRLVQVAEHFQIEARVLPKNFYEPLAIVAQVGSSSKISFEELSTRLAKLVLDVCSEIEDILKRESRVGTKNALMRYMIVIEELYVNIENIPSRKYENQSFYHLPALTNLHVPHLSNAIGYIDPNNEAAYDILYYQYRHLVEYITELSRNLQGHQEFSDNLEHIINKFSGLEITNTNHVAKLKINIIKYIGHIYSSLRDLAWYSWQPADSQENFYIGLTSEVHQAQTYVKPLLHDYLIMLQRMHIEIEADILASQKWRLLEKWGVVVENGYPDIFQDSTNFSNRYDENYYGAFAKYFNKWENKYQSTSDDSSTSRNQFGKSFQKNRLWQTTLRGEFRPKRGFRDYSNQNGILNREYEFVKRPQNVYGYQEKYSREDNYQPGSDTYDDDRSIYRIGNPEYAGKQNDYPLKGFCNMVKQIKNWVDEVNGELAKVDVNRTDVKYRLSQQVRELIQILGNIIDRLEEENWENDVQTIINRFKDWKIWLQRVLTYGAFVEVGQIQYQLSRCLEQVTNEIEKLVRIAEPDDVKALKYITNQFTNFIREVNKQMKQSVYKDDFEIYRTESKYNSKPWLAWNRQ